MSRNEASRQTINRGAFSPQELADHWGKSRQHIYNLINDGTLHSFKLGRSRLITVAEVERVERGGA